jgi:hypothetical protein
MSNPLPAWLERLLGIETGAGEGTAWNLDYAWGWPSWVTLVFAVFAVVFVVGTYLRENPQASRAFRMLLAGIRLLLVAMVLFMLAQFALSLHRTGLPVVVVIADDSLSMSIVDRYEEKLRDKLAGRLADAGLSGDASQLSRWNLAKAILTEDDGSLVAGIRRDHKLHFVFLTGLRPAVSEDVAGLVEEIHAAEPGGESSRLGAAVRGVLDELRGTSPAAVILVTDGINTDGPGLDEAAAAARRRGVPLLIVGLGDDKPVRDLKLSDLLVDEVVFVNDVVQFEAKLTGTGFPGREVRLRLRRDGDPRVLAETKVAVSTDGQPQTVRIPYRPGEEGEFRYVVEVEPLEGEIQTDNNRIQRTVKVRNQKIRVLLVQAYPSYEFRYLSNMFERDSTIELNTVLQEADLEHAEQAAAALRGFPVRRDELFRYDVIILGDVNPALLSGPMMENLAAFVEQPGKGGALVFLAGPRYMPLAYRDTPLERLMPVNLRTARYPEPDRTLREGFVAVPTDLGLASPPMQLGDTPAETAEIWARLPSLYWLMEAPDLKPGVRVLAVHPDRPGSDGQRLPVIMMQYVGAGKVLLHATDETWRWRWRTGDVFFARYWVQMMRYLSRSILAGGDRSAVLTTDRREYRRGESVRLGLRFADERLAPAEDDGVTVVLEQQGHQTRRIRLHRSAAGRGVFEGLVVSPSVGAHHAWVAVPTIEGGAPAVDFSVAAPPGEFERVEMDAAELKRAAQTTKGHFYTVETADQLLRDLPKGRQVPVEALPPIPLWNAWPLLALFLGLLIAEWILRKSGGMV